MVVPTYNERDRLAALLEQVFATCVRSRPEVCVVVVDDNSADGTGAIADEWARSPTCASSTAGKAWPRERRARGHRHRRERHRRRHRCRPEPSTRSDSDVVCATMVAADPDMVVASRYVTTGMRIRSWSAAGFCRGRCWLGQPLTPVRDAMSGFFLIRRECATAFRASARGFKIGLELLVRAHPRRVAEVGYVFVGREAGESKMSSGWAAVSSRSSAGLLCTVASVRRLAVPRGRPSQPPAPSRVPRPFA